MQNFNIPRRVAIAGFERSCSYLQRNLEVYRNNFSEERMERLADHMGVVENTHRVLIMDTSHSVQDITAYSVHVADQVGRLNILLGSLKMGIGTGAADIEAGVMKLGLLSQEISDYHHQWDVMA